MLVFDLGDMVSKLLFLPAMRIKMHMGMAGFTNGPINNAWQAF